jgi:hypothetical protein
MTHNLSSTDRIVRAGLGVVLAALTALVGAGSITGVVLLILAVVMVGTAAVGFCPLYAAVGFSTRPTPHRTRGGHVGPSTSG